VKGKLDNLLAENKDTGWGHSSAVEHLPSTHKTLGLIHKTKSTNRNTRINKVTIRAHNNISRKKRKMKIVIP
jgi:hypothetical protein